MQHSLAKTNQDELPESFNDSKAMEIIGMIISGDYKNAMRLIREYIELYPTSLGEHLMIANLIAQLPRAIYSPSKGKVLLTGDPKVDLVLLSSLLLMGGIGPGSRFISHRF